MAPNPNTVPSRRRKRRKTKPTYPFPVEDTAPRIVGPPEDPLDPNAPGVDRPLPPPAPGTYDPALDAQRRGSTRGLGYLTEDLYRGQERDTSDYLLGQADVEGRRGRAKEDLDRSFSDLDVAYARLSDNQAQRQARSGTSLGGAGAQARAKRAANEASDRRPLEVAHQRFGQDLDKELGQLALGYNRRRSDRFDVELPRAQREDTEFGLDIDEAKRYQSGAPPVAAAEPELGLSLNPDPRRRKRRRTKVGTVRQRSKGLGYG